MSKRIEDYALIGDCESAALVGRDGSIDWLCWPRFDSQAIFAALLGDSENGRWTLTAADKGAKITRRYRGNTLILETLIETAGGAATVIDFMPLREAGTGHLIRLVQGLRGQVEMATELVLRFDYGLIVPWITRIEGGIKAVAGPGMAVLRTAAPIEAEGYKHRGTFTVEAGETVSFVLSFGESFRPVPAPAEPMKALDETERGWHRWSEQCKGCGPYSDAVLRSLIALKALTYRTTGGIVAAPTTSLPEEFGGARNWDYRFCWLRDATFTLLALMNSGFRREAVDWRAWLHRAVAGSPQQMQIVYGLAGERWIIETEIPWLSGFEGSKPVRVGNAAADQLQLDVFGEVMDALFQGSAGGLDPDSEAWPLQCTLVEHLENVWHLPDEGIWEVRGGPRHFTHSKVMAWVALDRAIKMVERFGAEGPVDRWRRLRSHIHDQVCNEGFDSKTGAFTQSYGSSELDASALLIPLVGFLPASDPRVKSTADAIGERLKAGRLIRRYSTDARTDGLKGSEGVFLACSFWYADNLALLGRHEEARDLFEYLLTLRNDVGLLSEEYDPVSRCMLGNFPQAFSHVALINTAHNLGACENPIERAASCGEGKQ
ncbi:MAG: glycoside hydrolase family 15 protein [Rhodomicrobium sp.]